MTKPKESPGEEEPIITSARNILAIYSNISSQPHFVEGKISILCQRKGSVADLVWLVLVSEKAAKLTAKIISSETGSIPDCEFVEKFEYLIWFRKKQEKVRSNKTLEFEATENFQFASNAFLVIFWFLQFPPTIEKEIRLLFAVFQTPEADGGHLPVRNGKCEP